MKRLVFFATALIFSASICAQEEFIVAKTNSNTITVGEKIIREKGKIKDTDTIKGLDNSSYMKLYGSQHKKVEIIGEKMRKYNVYTIKDYLAHSTTKSHQESQTRNTTVRDIVKPIIIDDTLYLYDTLYYSLPCSVPTEGNSLEIRYSANRQKIVIPVSLSDMNEIAITRDMFDEVDDILEFKIWNNCSAENRKYILITGLKIIVLPEEND